MSKIVPTPPTPYVPTIYVTGDQIVQHYGVANVAALPTAEQFRYNNYASNSNLAIEGVVYRYIDTLPLVGNDELLSYLKGMALQYALLLKQTDDGANNVVALDNIVKAVEKNIIKVTQSQPKGANTRRMVSNGYPDLVIPHSQSYGLSDIL